MDDLKLYGRNPDQLELLHAVRTFPGDIYMKFDLDKCAVARRLSTANCLDTILG